ncbi:MAG: sensor domain-containing protein [Acidobacteria bacterium]|nr:sensor domain-containing protein [Acidobacteriota bacterium]
MSEQISTVGEYFDQLAAAFAGSDPAVAQDATYDAQEFLAGEREALEAEGGDAEDELELVGRLMHRFGQPREVVESYRATEAQVAAALAPPATQPADSLGGRIFGVFADPRTYGALFFMLVSLPLGIIYFTWAVTGLSLSIGLSVLIFGFVFFLFFISTVRAVALVECRIIETLLGERMPRRPPVVVPRGSWMARVKFWLTDKRTWLTILYMILCLPLGVLYFTVATVFLTFALSLMLTPFVQLFVDFPIIQIFDTRYFVPFWIFPFLWLGGAFDLLVLMHLARGVGHWHARLAKSMLARPGA